MRSLISFLHFCVVFAIINPDVSHAQVTWSFGRNTKNSYVLGREKGWIQFLEKTSKINLNVPKCHEVTYVRVQVFNKVSTPTVTYDDQAQVVTISYSWLQVSYSTYDILVRGRLIRGCRKTKSRNPVDCYDENGASVPCRGNEEEEEEI